MSLRKKVSLLVVLLLLLMIGCVYSHMDEFLEPSDTATAVSTPTAKEQVTQLLNSTKNFISSKLSQDETSTQSKEEVTPVVNEEPKEVFPKEEIQKDESPVVEAVPQTAPKEVVQNNAVVVDQQEDLKSFEQIQQEIDAAAQTKRIIFKRLSTDVTPESLQTIDKIVALMQKYPDIKIEVGGHTDAKGDDEVNAYVSKHRALSVRKLMIERGIDENRLSAKGYGESQPIVENDPQGYSILNRRVEFKIVKD